MKKKRTLLWCMAVTLLTHGLNAGGGDTNVLAGNSSSAAQAINALGLELLAQGTARDGNALLSPYSIQTALAMAFAGAAGETRAEMARVLHYAGDEAQLHQSFASLRHALQEVARVTAERAEQAKRRGGAGEPVTLTVANRLFGQKDYNIRAPFLSPVNDSYQAPLQLLDFCRNPAGATKEINSWVERQTRERIRDLIPPDALNKTTRLVLVNGIYLKAPWAKEFPVSATQPAPFHVKSGAARDVPTMTRQGQFGYARHNGFSLVTIPYSGDDVQFVILLPDEINGLSALESKLTPDLLASCANSPSAELILHLPKLKIAPPLFTLRKVLQSLGMHSAFDAPKGSANFDRMAPRKPDDYLYISEVFHKTFLSLDEKGTEAAAATAVAMLFGSAMPIQKPKPIEVHVDHPFLFAIQHRPSGACLFWGRITDP